MEISKGQQVKGRRKGRLENPRLVETSTNSTRPSRRPTLPPDSTDSSESDDSDDRRHRRRRGRLHRPVPPRGRDDWTG